MRVILGKSFRRIVKRGSIIWPHKKSGVGPVIFKAATETTKEPDGLISQEFKLTPGPV